MNKKLIILFLFLQSLFAFEVVFIGHENDQNLSTRISNYYLTSSRIEQTNWHWLIVERFSSKYPKELLDRHLKKIIFCGQIKDFPGSKTEMDSTFDLDKKAIIISEKYLINYYEPTFLERRSYETEELLHSEFSMLLLENNMQLLNQEEWSALSKIEYSEEEFNRHKKTPQAVDWYMENGFLDFPAIKSFEEDIKLFASILFCPNGFYNHYIFKDLTDVSYKELNQKTKLFIMFYGGLDQIFTQEYFKDLSIEFADLRRHGKLAPGVHILHVNLGGDFGSISLTNRAKIIAYNRNREEVIKQLKESMTNE